MVAVEKTLEAEDEPDFSRFDRARITDPLFPPPAPTDPAWGKRLPLCVFETGRPSSARAPLSTPPAPLAVAAPAPAAQAVARGQVVVLFGCRGGAGATTLSVNLASALARIGREVCLLDLDFQLGDVFVALDLEPKTSISALAREATSLDANLIRRRMQRHESGFHALSETGRFEPVDAEIRQRLPALLGRLKQHFDVILIDGVRDLRDHVLPVLDAADQTVLVFTQDVPAVRRAGRVIRLCRQLAYPDRKLRLVVNRWRRDSDVTIAQIERVLGLPVHARVVNDYQAARMAQDNGMVLEDAVGRARVTRDVAALAELLVATGDAPATRPRGLLARWFGSA